jgi:predicted RNase H-like nuclease (RuvC/YqgF family)
MCYDAMEDAVEELQEEVESLEFKLEQTLEKLEEVSGELEELKDRYKVHSVYDEMKIEAFWRNLGKYSLDYLENPEVTDNKGHHE